MGPAIYDRYCVTQPLNYITFNDMVDHVGALSGDPLRAETQRVRSSPLTVTLRIFSFYELIPVAHAPETGAENRLHFSGAIFRCVCHANMGPDSSGTRNRRRLEHCSITSQKLACT